MPPYSDNRNHSIVWHTLNWIETFQMPTYSKTDFWTTDRNILLFNLWPLDFNDVYLQCLQLYGTWLTNYIFVLWTAPSFSSLSPSLLWKPPSGFLMIGGFQPLRGSLVLITYLRYRVCAPPYFLVYNPGRAPVLTEFMFIKTPYKPNQILTYDNMIRFVTDV